jgi:L-ribulokinase
LEHLIVAKKYVIGLDFGTNSVRALLVDVQNGSETAMRVWDYAHGDHGVILDTRHPNLARQHPADYLTGIEKTVRGVLRDAAKQRGFSPEHVIGIGVDTTGSTPMPVDAEGQPLAFQKKYAADPAAMAWLWKDHTSHAEAQEITDMGLKLRPEYMAKIGGRYSSEWFWAKILRCARNNPKVFEAAYTWVEIADWIPASLAGNLHPSELRRGVCAAGHKAFYNPQWGGYGDHEFFNSLDPRLVRIWQSLPPTAFNNAQSAGGLSREWAAKLGLPAGITVGIGAFDCHYGAIGAGITANTLVKIIGTSTCDIMIAPMDQPLADIPGLCGIVPESVLPNFYGLEAGQSAVGDMFNWFVNRIAPGGSREGSHAALTAGAEKLFPGESGLLTLDWHNGNRTVLVDQRLTGLTLGLTLTSTPAEIYRSLIESTAFGARVIMERFEEYGVRVERVVNCGGIAAKNPLVMQIYADIMNRPIAISRSTQTCALGAAIGAAVAAGPQRGGYANFSSAVEAMTAIQKKVFKPNSKHAAVYNRLYRIYRQLHDAFGIRAQNSDMSGVMKELLQIRDEVRG